MAIPTRTETADGFEAHIGINHLGHFALTGLLLDNIKSTLGVKRIVNVASAAHLFGHLDRNNLMLTGNDTYKPWPAYGNSKLANILMAREFSRRLTKNNVFDIVPMSCHPGYLMSYSIIYHIPYLIFTIYFSIGLCRTDLGRYLFDSTTFPKVSDSLMPLVNLVLSPIGK